MQQPSLFTKIINGEIPCYKIYEDDKTFVFLDIHPVQPGHALVIPKIEVEFVWDLPEDYFNALMTTVKKVALKLRTELSVQYVGEKIIGTDIPHAHVHLIPFNTGPEFYVEPDESQEPDHEALAIIAAKLLFT